MSRAKVVELNEQFKKALNLLENTSKNVFITGRAGTGKSTLLAYFRNKTKKKIVVLAPTGVAAINVAGQTIHSFFRFKPDITLGKVKKVNPIGGKENIYKKLEAIVIDEISMVRADLLDCVDKFMRLNGKNSRLPFGGVQMVFIGDLYQLPPVVTSPEKEIFSSHYKSPYFFSSFVFSPPQARLGGGDLFQMEFIELEKIYRQSDQYFIGLLNAIRNNTASEEEIGAINARFEPDFETPAGGKWITLTTTNQMAAEINARIGEMEYIGKSFFGVEGYCLERKETRVFRVDRILEMAVRL